MSSGGSALAPVPQLMSHGARQPLPALTSIRFFAAIYVVLFHTNLQALFPGHPWLQAFLDSGYTAVTLFFALSGFILAYNYPQVPDRKNFWISRFARIYPAYFLAAVAILALTLAHPSTRHLPHLIPIFLANLFLVQAWWSPWSQSLNFVGWTLSVEALFYAIFPFAVDFWRRASRGRLALFTSLYLILALLPLLLPHNGADTTSLSYRFAFATDYTFPPIRLGTFFIGIVAGLYFARASHPPRWLLPISLMTTLLLLLWRATVYERPLKTMLLSYTFTAMIYSLALVNWKPLTNRWILLAGEISYSIYILQYVVLRVMNGLYLRGTNRFVGPLLNAAYIPVLIMVAYFSFHYIEAPARTKIRRSLGALSKSNAVAAVPDRS